MEVAEARVKVLENKKIEVKPIIRNKPFFKEGHDGEFMFTGCNKTYQLPFKMSDRSYINVFKSPEEQEAFEVLLNRPKGSLNIYDRNNEFWIKYKASITKEGKILDLSIPSHALEYRVLKVNSKFIAPSWAERGRASYDFALLDQGEELEESYRATEKFEEALNLLGNIKKSNKKMVALLKLMNMSVSEDGENNSKWLHSELLKVIDTRDKNLKPNIYDFVRNASDKRFDLKMLAFDALKIGEIQLRGKVFRYVPEDKVIGSTLDEVVDWLESIENQEARLLLEQRLQLNK